MNEYDLINAYLNLIFDDSITYFSRILDEYRGLCQLRKWMRKRGINLKAIENIGYDMFLAFSKAKNAEQIMEKMDPTHLEELKEYINTERNKYQIVVLSSFDYSEPINAYLTSNQIVDDLDSDNIRDVSKRQRMRRVRFGRPRKEIPENFEILKHQWQQNLIASRQAAKELGVSQDTFLRWAHGK